MKNFEKLYINNNFMGIEIRIENINREWKLWLAKLIMQIKL